MNDKETESLKARIVSLEDMISMLFIAARGGIDLNEFFSRVTTILIMYDVVFEYKRAFFEEGLENTEGVVSAFVRCGAKKIDNMPTACIDRRELGDLKMKEKTTETVRVTRQELEPFLLNLVGGLKGDFFRSAIAKMYEDEQDATDLELLEISLTEVLRRLIDVQWDLNFEAEAKKTSDEAYRSWNSGFK